MLFLIALNEDLRQLLTVELHEMFEQSVDHLLLLRCTTVMTETLHYQVFSYFLIIKHLCKNIPDIIHVCPPFEHSAEQSVLTVNRWFVKDIAIQSLGSVERSHSLYLNTRFPE